MSNRIQIYTQYKTRFCHQCIKFSASFDIYFAFFSIVSIGAHFCTMHFSNKKQNLPILFQPFSCSKHTKSLSRDPYLDIFGRRIDLEYSQTAKMVIQLCAAPMGATRGTHWGPILVPPKLIVLLPTWVSAVWLLNPRNRLKPLSNLSDHHVS